MTATPNNWFELDRRISSPCYPQSMTSPHMYDQAFPCVDDLKGKSNPDLSKVHPTATTKRSLDLCEGSVPDVSDLNSPELSFDSKGIIRPDSGHQVTNLDESFSLFSDSVLSKHQQLQPQKRPQFNGGGIPNLLQHQQQLNGVHPFGRYPMPQQSELCTEAALAIKREPIDHSDLSTCSQRSYTNGSSIYSFPAITERQTVGCYLPISRSSLPSANPNNVHYNGGPLKTVAQNSQTTSNKRKNKNIDKSSDKYRRMRELNNIAVRKFREKAKLRTRGAERKFSELVRENDVLRECIELLSRELAVLKNLLANASLSPDAIQEELAKTSHMDQFSGLQSSM